MSADGAANRTESQSVAAIAASQENVVSRQQLLDLDVSSSKIKRWLRAGRLFLRHPAVYSLTPVVSRLGEFWAAVLACGDDAALSHESAGHMYEVRRHAWGWPHVTVPRLGTRDKPGIRVHSSRVPFTRVVIQGLPVTDITRTLTDMADTLTPEAHQLAIATAERKELIDRATYTPLPGRKAIMTRPHLFTRSQNERAMFRLCEQHGLPLPLVNQLIDQKWEVDFLWPAFRRAVELDSWFTHKDPIAFARDRLKDEHLDLHHQIIVRRILDTRLHDTPDEVAQVLKQLLR